MCVWLDVSLGGLRTLTGTCAIKKTPWYLPNKNQTGLQLEDNKTVLNEKKEDPERSAKLSFIS